MGEISVNFIHPTDGRILTVTLDETMTAQEVIGELLANDFVLPFEEGYTLAVMGGEIIRQDQTFDEAKIRDGDKIRIIPSASAGGKGQLYHKEPKKEPSKRESGIPGLDKRTVKDFSIEAISNSPEAIIMIVHLYDDLQLRHEKLSTELEIERFRSRDRFVATLLLLISQVVLSIAGNLLTSNNSIAVPVFIAGGLQAALALYLTFRKPNV